MFDHEPSRRIIVEPRLEGAAEHMLADELARHAIELDDGIGHVGERLERVRGNLGLPFLEDGIGAAGSIRSHPSLQAGGWLDIGASHGEGNTLARPANAVLEERRRRGDFFHAHLTAGPAQATAGPAEDGFAETRARGRTWAGEKNGEPDERIHRQGNIHGKAMKKVAKAP